MFDIPDDSDSNVPRLRVSLRIRGAALDPEFLTQHLGVAPTFTARQGEARTRVRVGEIRTEGTWVYALPVASDTELGDLIEMLLAPFPSDTNLWEELTTTYSADVFCGVFLRSDNQGTQLPSETAARLGRLGLPLILDFYAAFGDSDES
jgi:hypothetical protein